MRAAVKKKGLSVRRLALALDIDRGRAERLLAGAEPKLTELRSVATVLAVPIELATASAR